MLIYVHLVHIPFVHVGPKASKSGYELSVHSFECSQDKAEQESHFIQSRFRQQGWSLCLKCYSRIYSQTWIITLGMITPACPTWHLSSIVPAPKCKLNKTKHPYLIWVTLIINTYMWINWSKQRLNILRQWYKWRTAHIYKIGSGCPVSLYHSVMKSIISAYQCVWNTTWLKQLRIGQAHPLGQVSGKQICQW